MRRAREECDEVVVSLFVNPTQFNQSSDLAAYPRDEARDAVLAAEQGVDYLFAPPVRDLSRRLCHDVSISGITEMLEGEHRGREHFEGVATVVSKLFNIVAPDVAYFGQKDAQQTLVIRRLVARPEHAGADRDLSDGARARRPRDVEPQRPTERRRASARDRAVPGAGHRTGAGRGRRDRRRDDRRRGRTELRDPEVKVEYLQIVNPETLAPITSVGGPALALVAAWVGETRLIDNQLLSVPTSSRPPSGGGKQHEE